MVRGGVIAVLTLAWGCATGDAVDPSGSGGGGGDASASGTLSGSPSGSGGASGSPTTSTSSGGPCVDPALDCPITGTACRSAVCSMGACTTTPAMLGTPCTDNGGTTCNATGSCVAPICTDTIKNGAETGVDCGGGTCPACADGLACAAPRDCTSGVCLASVCAACGGVGEPCCAGGTCDALPNTCAGNTFMAWGGGVDQCDCGVLRPGQVLRVNEGRRSCDGRFFLVMQGDGNLVLYYEGVAALWSSNTAGTPADHAVMQADGNFMLFDASNQAWWASGSTGAQNAFVAVQTDGNLVVYDGGNTPWWSSNTCCY